MKIFFLQFLLKIISTSQDVDPGKLDTKESPLSSYHSKVHSKEKDNHIASAYLFDSDSAVYLNDQFIPIDTSLVYSCDLEARSLGQELSKAYFFLEEFDENFRPIRAADINIIPKYEPVKVVGYTDTTL